MRRTGGGHERRFSTPAVFAVEIDGAENVSAEADVALLQQMTGSENATLRVDELRFPLDDVHRARLRELLRAAE